MKRQFQRTYSRIGLYFAVAILTALPSSGSAWNIAGHMLSGSIAYQILRRENPSTIATVKAILEKHPWFETHWKEQLEKLPESERDEMLFMLAPRSLSMAFGHCGLDAVLIWLDMSFLAQYGHYREGCKSPRSAW